MIVTSNNPQVLKKMTKRKKIKIVQNFEPCSCIQLKIWIEYNVTVFFFHRNITCSFKNNK